MKKRVQVLSVGLLICTLITSGTVFAKNLTEKIDVIYNNIKILIDGKEYTPTDANGNTVEPFIYNGTTYLPVRAIANAFDKEVGWNPENMTVSLGSQKFDWLYKLSYVDHQIDSCSNSTFTLQDNGIKLYQSGGGVWHEYDVFPSQMVAYRLDGNYTSFKAKLYNRTSNGAGAKITFYGDGKKILHSVPALSSESQEIDVDIDLTGQSILYIEVENVDYYEAGIVFADARLAKNSGN